MMLLFINSLSWKTSGNFSSLWQQPTLNGKTALPCKFRIFWIYGICFVATWKRQFRFIFEVFWIQFFVTSEIFFISALYFYQYARLCTASMKYLSIHILYSNFVPCIIQSEFHENIHIHLQTYLPDRKFCLSFLISKLCLNPYFWINLHTSKNMPWIIRSRKI